jgi:hypothetical protein
MAFALRVAGTAPRSTLGAFILTSHCQEDALHVHLEQRRVHREVDALRRRLRWRGYWRVLVHSMKRRM